MEYISAAIGSVILLASIALILLRRKRSKAKPVFYDFRLTNYDESEEDTGKTKALVTGGSGCLGKEIVRQLVASGEYIVHSLDLFIPPKEKRIAGVYIYIQADVTNANHVERALEGIDVVFHTVALLPTSVRNTPQAMQKVTVEGTRNIVSTCKSCGVKRLIYTSSLTVVFDKDPKITYESVNEQFPLAKNPLNAYVKTKGEAETIVREANEENGLRTCAVRLGGIVDMRSWLSNLKLVSPGNWTMSWIELESAAELHLLAELRLAKKPICAKTNAFNGISFSAVYGDVINFIALESTGRKASTFPLWTVKLFGFINETVFSLLGLAPFGDAACSMSMDFMVSWSGSPDHTKKELGWAEKRSWQEVMKKLIADI